MDKIKSAYHMALSNDDTLLCYSKGKKFFLWDFETKSILSCANKPVSDLHFSEDSSEITAVIEYPSSVVVYKTNQFDKPFFRCKFSSMFTPKAVYISNTNTLLVGCYDTIYYIDPDKNIVKSIYKIKDGSCSYITYHDSKLFVVFDCIASNVYKTTCVELRLLFNAGKEGKTDKISMDYPSVIEIKAHDFTENAEWFTETPKGEKYVALSGWKSFKIYHVYDWNKMEKVYGIKSMVDRTFVSGNNSIAGIVLRTGEETKVKLFSLGQDVRQIYEHTDSDYVYYARISSSGNYLLVPHSKDSKIIPIRS